MTVESSRAGRAESGVDWAAPTTLFRLLAFVLALVAFMTVAATIIFVLDRLIFDPIVAGGIAVTPPDGWPLYVVRLIGHLAILTALFLVVTKAVFPTKRYQEGLTAGTGNGQADIDRMIGLMKFPMILLPFMLFLVVFKFGLAIFDVNVLLARSEKDIESVIFIGLAPLVWWDDVRSWLLRFLTAGRGSRSAGAEGWKRYSPVAVSWILAIVVAALLLMWP